jgi:hypothetical protein
MNSDGDGLARSVQARLSWHARAIGSDPNLVLTRYAVASRRFASKTRTLGIASVVGRARPGRHW